MRTLVVVGAMMAYGACVAQTATADQKAAAQRTLVDCLLREAPRYDDRVSDATTVATAVARACTTDGEASFRAQVQGEGQVRVDSLRREWPAYMHQQATAAVLQLRVTTKK
jgi:hypothetical protein